jgi:hypothetical protein
MSMGHLLTFQWQGSKSAMAILLALIIIGILIEL